MEYRLLGPLEVADDGEPVALSAGKQRALLALLLLGAGRVVARDRIVDELWGAGAPETAQKMVQIHVSQLRRALPAARIETRGSGYALDPGDGALDVTRFERLAAAARESLARDDPATASRLLREALALWRGPALADLTEPFARRERARLEEERLAALEARIEADLALGRHAEVVPELEALVAEHPLRERLRGHHALALYRSGRHADALAGFRAYRRLLGDELGIEPSPELRELERAILRHDPSLAAPVAPRPAPPPADDEVRYARSGEHRIAFQVVGDGPLDLVLVHGWVCTFQPGWERPAIAAFYRRLASLGRLILFDKRGTGLSDHVEVDRLPDLETRMDDVRAVLDAAGSERAVVLGVSEGGAMSALFAATHPERTAALVLMGTFARTLWAPDYPIGVPADAYARRLAPLDADDWARATTEEWLGRVAPDLLADPEALRWYTSYVRRGASPAATRALRRMNVEIDIRDVLPTIAVPTLVLHRAREYLRDGTRFMGERIPGAVVVELPGNDHLPWEGDRDALLDEVERFLAGARAEAGPDRVLATLVRAELPAGDPDAERLARAQLARFRGRAAGAEGGVLTATFDGPARAIRCAAAIVEAAAARGIEARAGVHTGEVERTAGDDVRGPAVEACAAIAAAAAPGEVLASGTVRDLVAGSGLAFEERGRRQPPGAPAGLRLYAVRSKTG